jgi:hypothetical protein
LFCRRPQTKFTGSSYEIVNKFRWIMDFPNRFVETDPVEASVSTITSIEFIHVASEKTEVVIHLTNVDSYTYHLPTCRIKAYSGKSLKIWGLRWGLRQLHSLAPHFGIYPLPLVGFPHHKWWHYHEHNLSRILAIWYGQQRFTHH